MSSSSDDSEDTSSQNDSEYNYITDYIIETEQPQLHLEEDTLREALPYEDEPIADEQWIIEYQREEAEAEERNNELKQRLDGNKPIKSWCKCGNCEVLRLQNASECHCCQEIEACMESLKDELVVSELGQSPSCITLHPGFRPVCLERWSLRVSADKYRCKDRAKYRQIGSENAFLRSVSYREFTYLVHGYLGSKRTPLPACAYNAIRQTFNNESSEEFQGFELDE